MTPADRPEHHIVCHLDELLTERTMTLAELALRANVTVANLSVLKNNRARAIRFSTLTAICQALDCQPGDLLTENTAALKQPFVQSPSSFSEANP